ncbi:hypothetical protein GPL15_11870 [Clostridium sp. MCC353]|uniref:hypothetical protein n=1 Tax=Clostridium sp. MCC353 TaxID=2592646 RepID=UPI001C030DB8|nr:hypothetical protein [Clostridium sp. MCC353]MBT9777200.1 hypothetical protein [Clostridium sp. MCC353]
MDYDDLIHEEFERLKGKHQDSIFLTIYRYKEITHKKLMEILNISSSNLSVNIKKIIDKTDVINEQLAARGEGNITLIQVQQNKKENMYSLTSQAEKYIEKWLLKTEDNNPVKRFSMNVSWKWEYMLDELIIIDRLHLLKSPYPSGISPDMVQEFNIFRAEMKRIIINDCFDEKERVLSFPDNIILKDRINDFIDTIQQEYDKIKDLSELFNHNSIEAFRLIDELCCQIIHNKIKLEVFNEFEIEMDRFNLIKEVVTDMIMKAKEKNLTKQDAYELWCKDFPVKSKELVYYLAEKYDRYFNNSNG